MGNERKNHPVVNADTGERFSSIRDAAKSIEKDKSRRLTAESAICHCVSGRTKSARGIHWMYAEDYDAGKLPRKAKKRGTSPVGVLQVDACSGRVLRRWPSVIEAARTVYITAEGMRYRCNHSDRIYDGCYWQYEPFRVRGGESQ